MSFISVEFGLLFFAVVVLIFNVPQKHRWILLLVASYIFYMSANVYHIFIIVFSTMVDYLVSQRMGKLDDKSRTQRRLLLLLSIVVNLGVLFYFKYFNFFSESAFTFLSTIDVETNLLSHSHILPVGISFYTFQSMAYTFDVYRKKIQPEPHLGIFATYIAFFPQLVAGPIERASNMLPQFRKETSFEYDRVVSGLRLILWGGFKKIAIADRLAGYVNEVYNNPTEYNGAILIVATVFFGYQIYCDFSGYSDIAIGAARVLGFDLMQNFNHPYLSDSIRDFWRRWHISLSTWFRDYVYIPLGGNRVGRVHNLVNLLIVFLVSGLWHGAAWTFLIWGAIHGIMIIIETIFTTQQTSVSLHIPKVLRMIIIFCLVQFAWIFFRANSLPDAQYIISNMFVFDNVAVNLASPFTAVTSFATVNFVLSIGLIVGLQFIELVNEKSKAITQLLNYALIRWVAYYTATIIIIITLVSLIVDRNFIYFQF